MSWNKIIFAFVVLLLGAIIGYRKDLIRQKEPVQLEKVLADTLPPMASSGKTISTCGLFPAPIMQVDTMCGYEVINDSALGHEYRILVTMNLDPYGVLYKALRDSSTFYRGAWEEAVRLRQQYETKLWGPLSADEPVSCCKP